MAHIFGPMMTLGERVKERRKSAGFSQKKLGVEAGLTQPAINQIESGKIANPGIDHVVKLSKALHCSLEYLATGKDMCDTAGMEANQNAPDAHMLRWQKTVEIFDTVVRDATPYFSLNFDNIVGTRPKPPSLVNLPVFGVHTVNDYMDAYPKGDCIYVCWQHRPIERGQQILVEEVLPGQNYHSYILQTVTAYDPERGAVEFAKDSGAGRRRPIADLNRMMPIIPYQEIIQ